MTGSPIYQDTAYLASVPRQRRRAASILDERRARPAAAYRQPAAESGAEYDPQERMLVKTFQHRLRSDRPQPRITKIGGQGCTNNRNGARYQVAVFGQPPQEKRAATGKVLVQVLPVWFRRLGCALLGRWGTNASRRAHGAVLLRTAFE